MNCSGILASDMLAIVRSTQFRRDVKRAEARGKNLGKLREILALLIREAPLPTRYRDHRLRGSWRRHREAHIEPDWLLIYRIDRDHLHLIRTGTHSDLFSE